MKVAYAVVTSLVIAITTVSTPRADEPGDDLDQIPSCGSISTRSELWQYSQQIAVEGYSQSSRDLNGCLSKMRVEAWVEGVTMDTAINDGYGIAVSVGYYVSVPRAGTWNSVGKHWLINFGAWLWSGFSHGSADVEGTDPTPQELCESDPNNTWSDEFQMCYGPDQGSPIIVDTANNGYNLTSVDRGVVFDIDADGVRERVAWTAPGSDDAFLALDRNGNGVVDDGTELFGDRTPVYRDKPLLRAKNGFEALKFLEGPDFGVGVGNSLLDSSDAVFYSLMLWRDANHNGHSEQDELQYCHNVGIHSIETTYRESRRRDVHGNSFMLRGALYWNQPSGTVRQWIYDVLLRLERQ